MRVTRVFSNRSMATSSGYIARVIAANYSPKFILQKLGEAGLPPREYKSLVIELVRQNPQLSKPLGAYTVG